MSKSFLFSLSKLVVGGDCLELGTDKHEQEVLS
jgi:hypothetical protein